MSKLKYKIITIYFIIFNFNILFKKIYLNKKNDSYLIKEKKKYTERFLSLRERPINKNDSLFLEEKKHILEFIYQKIKRNITSIKRIIYSTGANFGNILLCLNKLIFFCEILGCTEITLHNTAFWFIKNTITLRDYNITINKIDDTEYQSLINQSNTEQNTIFYKEFGVFFYYYKIIPKIRINLIRDEIINNIPKLNVSRNDLYIHIRSGDIFTTYIHKPYAQPPLCFYKGIIKNFNFTRIYLLAQNNNNPTIEKLITKFKNIIYLKKSLEYDLSCLINSYNLAGSISSFFNTIIMLNSNLENLWEYNIYQIAEKVLQNHYSLFEFPNSFTIYRMEPTSNYLNKMYIWKNTKMQKKLMIKEKCINDFKIERNGYKLKI